MASPTYPCLKTIDEFADASFDYIIIGGGTAGLAIAARLSENADGTVGVIEAGHASLDDPNISVPGAFAKVIGNPEYDWMMETVPQAGTSGSSHAFNRGKVLGGSSAINLMVYIRGQAAEYDDWAKLTGYKDWGWEGLKPYFLKHEGFVEPPPITVPASQSNNDGSAAGGSKYTTPPVFEVTNHGKTGPVKTTFANWVAPVTEFWHEASRNAGLKWTTPQDAWSGNHLGGFNHLSTIDRSSGSGSRSYAASAYLKPNAQRPNLFVLTEVTVKRILIDKASDKPKATGIEGERDGKRFVAHARREIILSAGTVHTPQILERSGIGNRELLESCGIDCVVDNQAVGEHFEDHMMTGLSYDLADEEFSLDSLASEDAAKQAMGQYTNGEGGPLSSSALTCTGFISLAQSADQQQLGHFTHLADHGVSQIEDRVLRTEYETLAARLQDQKSASLQLFILPASFPADRVDGSRPEPVAGKINNGISVLIALAHPFSRGSIHINGADLDGQPLIDPHYLESPLDVEMLSHGVQSADAVFQTSPLKEKIRGRLFPPESFAIEDRNKREEYVRGHTRTEYHPIGTAGLGRVVDERLRVFGVDGLRVVDASIFPLSVSGNIQAPVYAVAEKAADIIKRD